MKLVILVSAILCSTFVSAKGDHKEIARHLEKRFSGHATYFVDGMGACGIENGPNDFIVALNTPQYGYGSPGPQCFKKISISGAGKTTVATITDECPGCPYGSLDFSSGLFKFFNPLGVGEFPITWTFLDGSGGGGSGDQHTTTPPPKAPPRTTHTHHTTPTSTPETSSTSTSTSTNESSSHKHNLKTHATTTTTTATSTSSSSSPSTTTSSSPPVGGNFAQMSEFILSLENLLDAASGN